MASSRVMPSGAVTRFSLVITLSMSWFMSVSNFMSRLVMMPISFPLSQMGTPEMRYLAISSSASARVWPGSQPEGVGDDAVLAALDHVHLLGLLADGHILVDDADAALTGDGDGHAVLGDGIHGGADKRDIQPDLLGQLGVQVDVGGQHVAGRGDQQHVVKGEALLDKLLGGVLIDHSSQLLFSFPDYPGA